MDEKRLAKNKLKRKSFSVSDLSGGSQFVIKINLIVRCVLFFLCVNNCYQQVRFFFYPVRPATSEKKPPTTNQTIHPEHTKLTVT